MRSRDYTGQEESLEYTAKEKMVVGAVATVVLTMTICTIALLYLELS